MHGSGKAVGDSLEQFCATATPSVAVWTIMGGTRGGGMETRCVDPKKRLFVELEADAVLALLNDSYRHLTQWATWEPRHNALAPLRLRALKPVETSMSGPPMYRIELRCEQAEALRECCDELAGILQDMEEQDDRDGGEALERTARVLDDAIRGPLR